MHGKFPKFLKSEYIDLDQSFQWMKYVGLKGETEGLVVAAQDQALKTRYYSKHIMKEGTTDKCRMCHQMPETAEHIMVGCQKLAATQYLDRHNKVAAVLYIWISVNTMGLMYKVNTGMSTSLIEWWRMMRLQYCGTPRLLQTGVSHVISRNKPDIVVREKRTTRCLVIDVAVPSDYNATSGINLLKK